MADDAMTIFKPSSWVKIGDDVPATIKRASVGEDGVTYEVVWWDGRNRHTAWLSPHEVKGEAVPELEIGFHAAPPSLADMGIERVGLCSVESVPARSNGAH